MDAVSLAVAAALLVLGVAALAVRRWYIAFSAVVMGVLLPLTVYSNDLDASVRLALIATAVSPVLAPLGACAFARSRWLVVVALVAGVISGPLAALLYDPFYDLHCLSDCDRNPLAVAHVGSTTHSVLGAVAFVAASALAAAALRDPRRWAVLLLALSACWIALVPARFAGPDILTGAVLLVVGGVIVAKAFDAKARVAGLTRALESAADVETALRSAVGDPGITVSYVLDPDHRFVDRHGLQTQGPAEGQVSTDIMGPGGVVARVHHDPEKADLAALSAALTGPARLGFENGRLAATVSRQAHALEASRRRIVVHADSERQRLERDLHDGAQQHLLALGLALRTSLDSAKAREERDVLYRCLASTHVVLAELRDLSHGFYPASLEQSGLGNALDAVADRAPVPVSVAPLPQGRLPAEVERAIYLLVARVAAIARHPLEVAVTKHEDAVSVVVLGSRGVDGVLADVFGVLGGTLDPDPDPVDVGAMPVVRGWLPLENHGPVAT